MGSSKQALRIPSSTSSCGGETLNQVGVHLERGLFRLEMLHTASYPLRATEQWKTPFHWHHVSQNVAMRTTYPKLSRLMSASASFAHRVPRRWALPTQSCFRTRIGIRSRSIRGRALLSFQSGCGIMTQSFTPTAIAEPASTV